MQVDEFRSLVGDDHLGIVELIHGQIVRSSVGHTHQSILGSLMVALKTQIKHGRLGIPRLNVCLDSENDLQPDLFWVVPEKNQCRLREDDYWWGSPDLIVEIISHSGTNLSVKRDRFDKFFLYEKHGVREYWIVEPEARLIEVFALQNGAFIRTGIYDDKGELASPVLGMTFKMSELLKGDS